MFITRKYFVLMAVVAGTCQLPLTAAAQGVPTSPVVLAAPAASVPTSLSGVSLRPVPGHPNAQGWLNPDFRVRRTSLHTLYIEPIEVQAAADSAYRDLSPNELAELNLHFREKLAAQLPPGLTLVAAPQPDSMLVNVALMQSEMKKDGFHLRNLTPFGFVISHAKAAAGVSKVSFASMLVGVKVSDPQGQPLLALTIKPQGIPADPGSALNPADADPNQVPMSPVRLDQMPAYLAAKTGKIEAVLQALAA